MFLLYDLLIAIAALFLLPVAFIKGLSTGRAVESLLERLAIYSSGSLQPLAGRQIIWIHAVSVGEVNAATPIISELKKRYPDSALVLSGITLTGRQIAESLSGVDMSIFFPVDLPYFTRRAFRKIKPNLIVLMETELWPNFILTAAAEGVPLALANGRISERSFSRYQRFSRTVSLLLQSFSSISAQDEDCAHRFIALGARDSAVSVSGNVKFDALVPPCSEEQSNDLQTLLPLNEYVWVAGSTHPGENEQVLQAHRTLLEKGIPSFLILAPRHPERFDSVAEMLKRKSVSFIRRSEMGIKPIDPETVQMLLLDTLGELNRIYRFADVVFVGGSLIEEGGHNLLEPAQLGKPVIFGPHMFENRETARLILNGNGGRQVLDEQELAATLELLFEDIALRSELGGNAQRLVGENSGATLKTLQRMEPYLMGPHE